LILAALSFGGIVLVARRQLRFEQTVLKKMRASGSLLEIIVVALRASETRTQELNASLKGLGTRKVAEDQELSSIALLLGQIRASQGHDKMLVGQISRQLIDRNDALASTIEGFDKFREIAARRDERLIAIDATATAIEGRLAKLSAQVDRSSAEQSTLAARMQSLETSVYTPTNESDQIQQSGQQTPGVSPLRVGKDRVAERDPHPAAIVGNGAKTDHVAA